MSREDDLQQISGPAQAYQSGQHFFVARLKLGVWGMPGHGELPTWGESLQAIEAVGWVLDKWSVSSDTGGGLNAFPVFRRSHFLPRSETGPMRPTPQDRP